MTRNNDTVITEISEALMQHGFEKGMVNAIGMILNQTMVIDRDRYLNAEPYERTGTRVSTSNGFKGKTLMTRVGAIPLKIPQTRDCQFYPQTLEKGIRSERALRLALAEMYIQGVSTRRVLKITEELCGFEVSSTQVSRLTAQLDTELSAWRNRPLGEYQHLIMDARYETVRYSGAVQDMAVIWAIGVTAEGQRSVLGVSVSLSEAEPHWRKFLGDLVGRGLHGVQYIVSDDHAGLGAARKAVFSGVPWQRCQFHLAQNSQNHISKKLNKELVGQEIRTIFNATNQAQAEANLKAFISQYEKTEPKLTEWAEHNIPEGFTVYQLDSKIQKKFRTSNLCERINQEMARRTKIIRVFPNEGACLRLVTAILVEIDEDWSSGRRFFQAA